MDSRGSLSPLLGRAMLVWLFVLDGLAILVGWQTRWAALALAAFTVVAAVLYHYVPAQAATDPAAVMGRMLNFTKNIAIGGGLVVLAGLGAGRFALDARRTRAAEGLPRDGRCSIFVLVPLQPSLRFRCTTLPLPGRGRRTA